MQRYNFNTADDINLSNVVVRKDRTLCHSNGTLLREKEIEAYFYRLMPKYVY